MRWFRSINKHVLTFCCVLLFLGMWPAFFANISFWGTLVVALFISPFILNPVVGLLFYFTLGTILLVVNTRRANQAEVAVYSVQRSVNAQQSSIYNTGLAIGLAALLLFLQVPRRVGFLVSWPFFARSLRTTVVQKTIELKEKGSHQTASLNPEYLRQRGYELPGKSYWTGLYHISSIGIDPHGGTYFVTGFSGFGSIHAFYGFSHKPHANNTPFGKENYQTRRIFGNWHLFKVTDESLDL